MKAITHTYSLTETHILRVKQMAEETGLSEGLIIRNAIDLLLENYKRLYPIARGHLFRERVEELPDVQPADHITRISDLVEVK